MNIPKYQSLYYSALKDSCVIHANQKYDEYPYVIHLISVAEVLSRFGFLLETHSHLHIAALFHDSIEDQNHKVKELKAKYGERVATIVYLCTDEKGLSREERHRKTYPLIAEDDDAIIVKLCDRIANTEYGISTDNLSHYRKYRREYEYFRTTLKKDNNDLVTRMWNHLDSLYDWKV